MTEQYLIGALDIGGTKIAASVVSFDFPGEPDRLPAGCAEKGGVLPQVSVHPFRKIPPLAMEGGAQVLQRVTELAQQLVQANPGICALGIGSAGVISMTDGSVASATDTMPGWAGQPLAERVREAVQLPVYAINDVCAHGLSEAVFGAGRGLQNVLAVAAGTGLGGAVIINQQLYAGQRGVAGHIGHIAQPDAQGLPCSCGSDRGHIEAVSSGYGVAQLYQLLRREAARTGRNLGASSRENPGEPWAEDQSASSLCRKGQVRPPEMKPEEIPGQHGTSSIFPSEDAPNAYEVQKLAEAGEETAQRAYQISGQALGEVLAGLANSLDPDVIVLSGSLVKAGELWVRPLRETFQAQVLPLLKTVPIKIAQDSDQTALIGAAWYAYQHWHPHQS